MTNISRLSRRGRVEVMQDRLAAAVDYASTFRSSVDEVEAEACERAIRYANMLSQAIVAMDVK